MFNIVLKIWYKEKLEGKNISINKKGERLWQTKTEIALLPKRAVRLRTRKIRKTRKMHKTHKMKALTEAQATQREQEVAEVATETRRMQQTSHQKSSTKK